MALTEHPRVETLEEGGGDEEVDMSTSIDYFFSLLSEAAIHVKELQKTVGKAQVDIAKLVTRAQDWLEFQEETWDGATGPAKAQLSLSGLKTSRATPTSTSQASPRDGALAGPTATPSDVKGVKPKGKNK